MSDLLSDPDPDRDQAYQHPSVYDIAVPSTSQPGPSDQRLTVQDRNLYPFQPMAQYPLNFRWDVSTPPRPTQYTAVSRDSDHYGYVDSYMEGVVENFLRPPLTFMSLAQHNDQALQTAHNTLFTSSSLAGALTYQSSGFIDVSGVGGNNNTYSNDSSSSDTSDNGEEVMDTDDPNWCHVGYNHKIATSSTSHISEPHSEQQHFETTFSQHQHVPSLPEPLLEVPATQDLPEHLQMLNRSILREILDIYPATFYSLFLWHPVMLSTRIAMAFPLHGLVFIPPTSATPTTEASTYRNLSKDDIQKDNVVPGCPDWTRILALAIIQLAFFELRFAWFISPALRRLLVEMHLFLAGVSIGRCAEDPEWQPEECNHEKKFYVGTLETISSVFIDIAVQATRSVRKTILTRMRKAMAPIFPGGRMGSISALSSASLADTLDSYMPIHTFTDDDGKPLTLRFSGKLVYTAFLSVVTSGNTDIRQHWFGLHKTVPLDGTQFGSFPDDVFITSASFGTDYVRRHILHTTTGNFDARTGDSESFLQQGRYRALLREEKRRYPKQFRELESIFFDAAVSKGGPIAFLPPPAPDFPMFGINNMTPSDQIVNGANLDWKAEHSQLFFATVRTEDRWW